MKIFKEKKNKEKLNLNQVETFMKGLTDGLDPTISIDSILSEVENVYKIDKKEQTLPQLLIKSSMAKSILHPDYLVLASRIFVAALHRTTKTSFVEKMEDLYKLDTTSGASYPLITAEQIQIIKLHKKRIEKAIDYNKDYAYSILALNELKQTLLAKIEDNIVERPQDYLMRIAVAMHKNNIDEIIKTYTLMSEGLFLYLPSNLPSHQTRQKYSPKPYSITIKEENTTSFFKILSDCAQITESTKEIGISVHNVPSKTFISTLNLLNDTVDYINQTKETDERPFTLYIEPWHANIFEFLTSQDDASYVDAHISNLNRALWLPDLFMERVENNGDWTLMCPSVCPGLSDVYGSEFETLYKKYEVEGKGLQTIKAQKIWFKILETQIESGTIRILFKDQYNPKLSRSQATIKASEHLKQACKPSHFAGLSLPQFVNDKNGFNFNQLFDVVARIIRTSSSSTENNHLNDDKTGDTLPVHIEVQGFAELLLKLKLPFCAEEASQINKEIFETIQFAAATTSNQLAKEKGICKSREEDANWKDYFHLDLWNMPTGIRWNWMNLKKAVKEYGLYIPYNITCSFDPKVSKILGNVKGSSPISSYVQTHKWSTSDALVMNAYLLHDLIENKVWTPLLLQEIIQSQGAVQSMKNIPASIREVYKTAWEVSQKNLIDKVSEREYFGITSPSIELFVTNPNFNKLTSIYFYSWKKRLRTGLSSLRTKIDPQTMDFSIEKKLSMTLQEAKKV